MSLRAGLGVLLASALAPTPAAQSAAPRDTIAALCQAYSGLDQDGDGHVELARLTAAASFGEAGPRVLVLVEARLTAPPFAESLTQRIERLARDLAAEGKRADIVHVELGASERHQDGRYVLALRELLRGAARLADPLEGCLLIGRFPDAFIVRTCSWRRTGDLTLHRGSADERTWSAVPYVRRVPEGVAQRADIVLADLDGRWEDVYIQPETRLAQWHAVFPDGVPPHGGPCADVEVGAVTFRDVFHVSDGKLEVEEVVGAEGAAPQHAVRLFDRAGDHECSDADRAHPNVLAHPDLYVSRIDARGSAQQPDPSVVDAAGHGLLDDAGRPQPLQFASAADVPDWRAVWEYDAALERRLLEAYLDRNHAYRTTGGGAAWRATSLACGLPSGHAVVARAADDWLDRDRARADVHGQPTLLDATEWFAYPAVLRTVRAHSDEWGSVFAKSDTGPLDERLGGPAWSWTKRGERLEPSLRAACGSGRLDWYMLRSLWENGVSADGPSLYLHTGCDAVSPPGAARYPYDDRRYGVRQGAEALLFFGGGVALVGRAKVFYDEPQGFAEALRDGGQVGAAWAHYFAAEGNAPTWGAAGGDIGRKRAYFWSVLGDASVTLAMGRGASMHPAPSTPALK